MPAFRLCFTADIDFTTVLSVMFWCALTLVLCVAGFFGYRRYKNWMNEPEDTSATGFGFSDLRELQRQGKITAEEYEKARAKMLASAKQMTDKLPAPLASRRQPPSPPPPAAPPGAIT
jgi:hypothetical protein